MLQAAVERKKYSTERMLLLLKSRRKQRLMISGISVPLNLGKFRGMGSCADATLMCAKMTRN
jgi:hypothetical protein